ncbi:MAG: molybdenum cofactor guanylyltransferase [Nitrospinota bacterium]
MSKEVGALVLAGGKSTRMGTNKSFVTLGGMPLIQIIVEKLARVFEDRVYILTNTPALYKQFRLPMISDRIKDRGPLSGIQAGLSQSPFGHNFFVACDMPYINPTLIGYMTETLKEEFDVTVPLAHGRPEPLHGFYSKNCLPEIERLLESGRCRLTDLFDGLRVRYVSERIVRKFDPHLVSFNNLNTPEDLSKAQAMMGSGFMPMASGMSPI